MIQDTPNTLSTVQLLLIVQYLNLWRHCLLTCGSECRHLSPIVVLPQVNFPLIMLPLSHVKNTIALEMNNEDGDNIMKREWLKFWLDIWSVFSYDQNKLAVTERVWPLSGHFWLNINIIILIILRSKFAFITLVVLMLGVLILKFQTKVSCCSSFLVHHSLVHYPSFSYSSTCTSFIILKYSRSQWSSLSSSFFPWPSSRSCLTTGRVLLPEWVDGIARPHLAPLAVSWAQWFSSRDYIWTALIFQTVSLFVEFSSFLPHLHNKKISVVGHRRDSNVDLLSTHCG